MRTEGKISKVAICEKCNGFVLAGHIDYIDKQTEKEFTEFANEGFTVKLETADETRSREFADYIKCSSGFCKN